MAFQSIKFLIFTGDLLFFFENRKTGVIRYTNQQKISIEIFNMNKDTVLKQIEEKLSPAIKNLENGNASEHDIFPSLLWLLLENSKELEKSGEITKAGLLESLGDLKQVLQEDVKTVVTQENQKTLSLLKWVIGLCAVQFIGLGALAAIILMR